MGRLSYANVTATLARCLALVGGAALAAGKIAAHLLLGRGRGLWRRRDHGSQHRPRRRHRGRRLRADRRGEVSPMDGLRNHIRSNVVGYAAIFLALTGSAVALPGRATVQSNDLKPNAVKAKHIKDGQVGDAEISEGGLTGTAIADDSLGGGQVAEESLFNDNSLTGDDINEATLDLPGGGPPTGPAGGDLTGAYPNPEIGQGRVGAGEVADNALTGTDIDEATLAGVLRFGGSIPSGTTITGVVGCASNEGSAPVEAVCRDVVTFPVPAPVPVAKADFAPGGFGEDEPTCTGNNGVPTAPPGQVCVYELSSLGESGGAAPLGRHGFIVSAEGASQAHILALWAYQAP